MRIRLEVDLQLSPLQARLVRWGVVAGVVVGAVGLGVAFAGLPTDTSWIAPGQPVKAAPLLQNLNDLQAQFYDPACPMNYTLVTGDGGVPVVCDNLAVGDAKQNAYDEVVKVGSGWSAFWIDRYEATVFDSLDNTGMASPKGGVKMSGVGLNNPYPSSFLGNGQAIPGPTGSPPLYAVSRYGEAPSGGLTWFQAMRVCAASGKRLPTGQEWLLAATNTSDDGAHGTYDGNCITAAGGPNTTGSNDRCVSYFGAIDMIGNLWEWTADWFATIATDGGDPKNVWPIAAGPYYADSNTNVVSTAFVDSSKTVGQGMPVVALRGGAWDTGTGAGVFALTLEAAPSASDFRYGVRCVIPR